MPPKITREVLRRMLALCCVGARYFDANPEHGGLVPRKHYKPFKRFLNGFEKNLEVGKGLFIYGDFGTGKTSLAVIVMKKALYRNLNPFFVRASWLPKVVIEKPRVNYLTGDDVLVKDICETCDVLVIDNLNEELAGKWQSTALEDLIRDRYEEKKMTIVTSNMSPKSLSLVVSRGTTSLMGDTLTPLKASGPSWRAKGQVSIRSGSSKG